MGRYFSPFRLLALKTFFTPPREHNVWVFSGERGAFFICRNRAISCPATNGTNEAEMNRGNCRARSASLAPVTRRSTQPHKNRHRKTGAPIFPEPPLGLLFFASTTNDSTTTTTTTDINMGLHSRLTRSRELHSPMGHGGRRTPRRRRRAPGDPSATTPLLAGRPRGHAAHHHSLSCRVGCTACGPVPFTKEMRGALHRCRRCGGMGASEVMALDLTQRCRRCGGSGFEP